MKNIILSTFVFALFAMGGLPHLHNVYGRDWGAAVSSMATSGPGEVADHIRG
jgi:hypothetical protein